MKTLLFALLLLLGICSVSIAGEVADGEHKERPDLAALYQSERFFDVLVAAQSISPKELTAKEQIVIARSAWTLGLVGIANDNWESALRSSTLSDGERARELFGRAMMELQESRYEQARGDAIEGYNLIGASELKAQLATLIGETFRLTGKCGEGERWYKEGVESAGRRATKNEAQYYLGKCQMVEGKTEDVRYSMSAVESESDYGGLAVRDLMTLDYKMQQYDEVLTWGREGRESEPQLFSGPWVDYAMIVSLAKLGQAKEARAALGQFANEPVGASAWQSLAEAEVEEAAIKEGQNTDADSQDKGSASSIQRRGPAVMEARRNDEGKGVISNMTGRGR